jgi:malic enzyme
LNETKTIEVRLRGQDLIREPLLNKGSAFTAEERQMLGLEGLLPHRPVGMDAQAQRTYSQICRFGDPLERYVALAALQDRNEHLYFYLLREHLEDLLPVVYTPTVGLATQRFSHVFQKGRGVWITPDMQGRVADILRGAARGRDIRLIVATDNESILGIGDQGAGGIAIAIGKLSLYTAAAGIDPATVLPVSLDVGTDNEDLLNDPVYLGWPHRRVSGDEYQALLDEFVAAVQREFPQALLQWEDFRKNNALAVMDRYRDRILSFNDDIQGTGAVALAGLLGAARVHGRALTEERVVILGAGAAGLGIARQIRSAMQAEGLAGENLQLAIAALDSKGLIVADGTPHDGYKQELAWPRERAVELGLAGRERGLTAVCESYRPTVLIGTSGQHGAFDEAVVRTVARYCDRPVILPLSNPTEQSEAEPEAVYRWSDGQALVATGSPFDDVQFAGRRFRVGQGNNAFIFPGVGLGALASEARAVTDGMFTAAAMALADALTEAELKSGLLYPAISRLHDVTRAVAFQVAKAAARDGVAPQLADEELESRLDSMTWVPEYPHYVAAG